MVLSDGVMTLTLLNSRKAQKAWLTGYNRAALHHFGFVLGDPDASRKKVEAEGGQFFMKLLALPGVDSQSKFKNPNGVAFDMSEHDWQQAR